MDAPRDTFRTELMSLLSEVESAASVSSGLRVAIELHLASALIDQGALDKADDLLVAAARQTMSPDEQTRLGELTVRLGAAWQRSGNRTRAEAALKRAVAAGFGPAHAALAQLLRREERFAEAMSCWRDAIRAAPRETAHYLNLARLQEQVGESEGALRTYLDLSVASPSLASTLLVADRIDALESRLTKATTAQTIRIALLGNATLDHLRSYLEVEAYRSGLRPVFYQADFDQYTQEILNPGSGLYEFRPDVVVCAVHGSRLFPLLHDFPLNLSVDQRRDEIEAGLDVVRRLFDAFTEHSSAMLLFHNMVVPQHPVLGILDWRDQLGQAEAFAQINARLADLARTRYRNVYIVDEERIQARHGKVRASDARYWFTARMPWSEGSLAGLSREYLRYMRAAKGLSRKCIVVDLDHTLWGGTIGEDGLAGIQLGVEAPGNAFVAFQRELEKLWRRGVLLAICSKNNPEDALPAFEQHPDMVLRQSHFAAQRINWQPKATNIREIARELNIGLDSLVFLDDNPVERAAVRVELPQVFTPDLPTDPADYRRALLDVAELFDTLALTDEDRNRNRQYVEQRARQAVLERSEASGSLADYLAELNIVVDIDAANDVTLPRIAQLTNKTNQFNLTTRRYTEADIQQLIGRGWRVYSARVRDRFGDNGLTGVIIAGPTDPSVWSIDSLLLSCRVMGRGVETALLARVIDEARRLGASRLEAEYIPTPRNEVVRDCFLDHGFALIGKLEDGTTRWWLDPQVATLTSASWLTVRAPELVV